MDTSKVVGSFEVVSFPTLGVHDVIAKVDTGAYSGTIHATNIQERTGDNNETVLEFWPFGDENLKQQTSEYTRKQISS